MSEQIKPTYTPTEIIKMIPNLDLEGIEALEALLQEEDNGYFIVDIGKFQKSINFRKAAIQWEQEKKNK